MSQTTLVMLLQLGWQNYRDHLEEFAAYKQKYTNAVAETALRALAEAEALPNEQTRGAVPERTHGELLVEGPAFLDMWHLLDGYIEEAWPAEVQYKAQRNAAGHNYYTGAAAHEWGALVSLVGAATQFVTANEEVLVATGDMPEAFARALAEEGMALVALVQQFQRETQAAQQGTSVREVALMGCLETFATLGRDAHRIFRRVPEVGKLFEVSYLQALVGGNAQAGIRGLLTLASGAPAAGVPVEVPGLQVPHTAVSGADGRYEVAVAAGSYTLVLGGSGGYVRQELDVVVRAGVKRRLNAVVGVE